MGQSFQEELSDLLLLKLLRSATEASKDRDKVGLRGRRVELVHLTPALKKGKEKGTFFKFFFFLSLFAPVFEGSCSSDPPLRVGVQRFLLSCVVFE